VVKLKVVLSRVG